MSFILFSLNIYADNLSDLKEKYSNLSINESELQKKIDDLIQTHDRKIRDLAQSFN